MWADHAEAVENEVMAAAAIQRFQGTGCARSFKFRGMAGMLASVQGNPAHLAATSAEPPLKVVSSACLVECYDRVAKYGVLATLPAGWGLQPHRGHGPQLSIPARNNDLKKN